MEALLAFGAALLALRLGGALAGRWRAKRRPELAAWSAALVCYAIAAGALAWGAAGGWSEPAFRVYYLFGGLLTAALLGLGSTLLYGWRWTLYPGLVYVGLAIGVAIAAPIHGDISGTSIPEAQEHLGFLPARLVAILGNSIGTIAVIGVAIATIRAAPAGERADHHRSGCCRLRQRVCGPRRCGKRCFCRNCSTSSLRRFYSPFGCAALTNRYRPSLKQLKSI